MNISVELSEISSYGGFFALTVGGGTAGWYPVGQSYADGFMDLIDANISEPLAAGLRVKVAPALLSGNIASALVGASRALLSARPDLRQRVVRITQALLGTGELAGSGMITSPDLEFKRRSCCLFYRVPSGFLCGDCALSKTPGSQPHH